MSNTTLPPIGIGTYQVEPDDCETAVETALNLGYRHVDTAEMYENEAAVGNAIEAADVDRDSIVVATKVHSRNLAFDDVIDAALASRERLGVDVIDLLYVHWPIRTYDPAETLPAFDELVDRGVIRHVGLSNFTPELLEEALEILSTPPLAHQVECHPLLPQTELRELAVEHDHTLVAYSPLAKGSIGDVPALDAIAAEYDATPAQIALAWHRANERVVPIPKSTTPEHIRKNIEAMDIELDESAIDRIDAIEERRRTVDFEGAPWNR